MVRKINATSGGATEVLDCQGRPVGGWDVTAGCQQLGANSGVPTVGRERCRWQAALGLQFS